MSAIEGAVFAGAAEHLAVLIIERFLKRGVGRRLLQVALSFKQKAIGVVEIADGLEPIMAWPAHQQHHQARARPRPVYIGKLRIELFAGRRIEREPRIRAGIDRRLRLD